MAKFLVRILLLSLAFEFILPMINGIEVHGNFLNSIGLGTLYAVLGWVVSWVAAIITTVLAVSTLGLALIVLLPLWLLGFWLLPVVVLKLIADITPGYLVISGWMPAVWGGLIMFFIGVITDSMMLKPKRETAA